MQLFDLVDVWRFVERTTQSCLELSVVGLRVTLLPATCVLRPFLRHDTQTTARHHYGNTAHLLHPTLSASEMFT